MKKTVFILTITTAIFNFTYSQNKLTYAGNAGIESFNDVVQLSNGKFIVSGSSENLDWVANTVPRTELTIPTPISNALGGGDYGFILLLDSNLINIEQLVYLPLNAAEDIRFIKLTSAPRTETGDIFVSGNTSDSRANGGGYFLAKLNNNFVNGIPTGLSFVYNNWAEGEVKVNQPWDVDGNGNVTFVQGQSHANDWAVIHRINSSGQRILVNEFRSHWKQDGTEYRGLVADYPGNVSDLNYSGFVLKTSRCDMRSNTMAEFMQMSNDGNGGQKRGKYPYDVFYSAPCNPSAVSTSGPGYTGYRQGGSPVFAGLAIAVDKRNGEWFFGMNAKSTLPDNLPDFEPAVVKFNTNGGLEWWSRLYHEINPAGDTMLSTPDQYVDALAIDYSLPINETELIVLARCHGNNVENFWEGNTVNADPTADGFQRQFTGTNGNIHISWIGKLATTDGTLKHSTYVAENNEGYVGGTPFASPSLVEGWPNPNTGWASLNSTRGQRSSIKITADGSVLFIGFGRRTITTTTAHQQNLLPGAGTGSWNQFVRMYSPDLKQVQYSSLITGVWDAAGVGADNTELMNVVKTRKGLVVVGKHKSTAGVANGNSIPVTNVPSWGNATPNNQSAILAYFEAPELVNNQDGPTILPSCNAQITATNQQLSTSSQGSSYQWYNCSTNSTIANATATTFVPTISGNYAVIVTFSDGCVDTSTCEAFTISTNSVEENWISQTNVYPNPTNGLVNVSFPGEATVSLIDINGRLVYSSNYNSFGTIDLTPFAKGTYSLIIQNESVIVRKRIVKQ